MIIQVRYNKWKMNFPFKIYENRIIQILYYINR